jgi:hypothetical protein
MRSRPKDIEPPPGPLGSGSTLSFKAGGTDPVWGGVEPRAVGSKRRPPEYDSDYLRKKSITYDSKTSPQNKRNARILVSYSGNHRKFRGSFRFAPMEVRPVTPRPSCPRPSILVRQTLIASGILCLAEKSSTPALPHGGNGGAAMLAR